MDWGKQYVVIDKLRALADHPSTPVAEALSARQRIKEIEEKIAAERVATSSATPTAHRRNANDRDVRVALRKFTRNPLTQEFIIEWPFGWKKRSTVDIESLEMNGKVVLGWKCPDCGLHVEREISVRFKARLQGKPGGVAGFIAEIADGKVNQLCDECWHKYR